MTLTSVKRVTALLLVYISSINYQAFGFFGNGKSICRSIISTPHMTSTETTETALYTTSLEIPQVMPRDSYKEGPDPSEDMVKTLEPLEGKNPIEMTMEELQAKWIDMCIEQSRPQDMDNFSLLNMLPLVIKEHEFVVLVNKSAEAIEKIKDATSDANSVIYVTEQELQRVWKEASATGMGKPVDSFDAKYALLLLNDEEDNHLVGDDIEGNTGLAVGDNLMKIAESLSSEIKAFDAGSFEDEEGVEYIITTDELKRIWNDRAEIPWGMAGKEFDEKLALLQVDDDDADDETEYVSALYYNAEEEDALGFWSKYDQEEDLVIRDTLKTIHDDLDDMTYNRPAWKKDRHILTPDIDTQEFMGDLMWSNTYMTQRIPANWNDPEADEMSDTYHSASTMAWPGEEETDFNFQPPSWEILGLPLGKNFIALDTGNKEEAVPTLPVPEGNPDWNTFDFSADETFDSSKEDQGPLDIDNFFSNMESNGEGATATATATKIRTDGALKLDDYQEEEVIVEATPMTRNSDLPTTISRGWMTPRHWTTREEFHNHVGFSSWSEYPEIEFNGADDSKWEEDYWMEEAMTHVQTVTEMYLTDHQGLSALNDNRKYWDRTLSKVIGGEEGYDREPIPGYLTPDIDRGVIYSDELIEMKGKLTLHMYQDPPHILYANDSFTHNTDFQPINKIGTIRDQYEWQPQGNHAEWLIEESVVEKIQPLIKFINHAGVLQSTKNNILVFDYKGLMRHIPGIRSMMLSIAASCFPEMADLRIETERTSDKFDR